MMTSLTANEPALRAPAFFEFSGDSVEAGVTKGQRSWFLRAQNCVVCVSWLGEGETLVAEDIPDEHALLVQAGTAVDVICDGRAASHVGGPSFVVIPRGTVTIVGEEPGFFLRVFTARATSMLPHARNGAAYTEPDASIAELPPFKVTAASTLRTYAMADVPDDPHRVGRIFRTDSLMINWFEPQMGPRDTSRLTPHSHDDFEQVSVALAGEFVHHLRRPWTARLADWRPDEHVQLLSPSVTVIPPKYIHTTRAVGEGLHQLVDVFAPPREDFIERGWVLNQADYD